MALPDKPRVLWIDAICINQADMQERSRQVTMMGDIYTLTAQNLVFLGAGGKKTAKVKSEIDEVRRSVTPHLGQSITTWLRGFDSRQTQNSGEISAEHEAMSRARDSTFYSRFTRSYLQRFQYPDCDHLPDGRLLASMREGPSSLVELVQHNPWFRYDVPSPAPVLS